MVDRCRRIALGAEDVPALAVDVGDEAVEVTLVGFDVLRVVALDEKSPAILLGKTADVYFRGQGPYLPLLPTSPLPDE